MLGWGDPGKGRGRGKLCALTVGGAAIEDPLARFLEADGCQDELAVHGIVVHGVEVHQALYFRRVARFLGHVHEIIHGGTLGLVESGSRRCRAHGGVLWSHLLVINCSV